MSVTVRPYRRGGWEVDITVRLPNGSRHRERSKAPVSSKSAAQRWGEDRERHLLQHGLAPSRKKEVPTLEEFAPRFLDGYARANRQKPSGIAAKETILKVHLIPLLGSKNAGRDHERRRAALKRHLQDRAPKTVNNVLTVLNVLLKKAVEWDVDRPNAVRDPAAADSEAVGGVLRLRRVRAAGRRREVARSERVPHRALGRRCGASLRRDHGARVARRRSAETAALRPALRLEGSRHGAEGRAAPLRAADGSAGDGASRASAFAVRRA